MTGNTKICLIELTARIVAAPEDNGPILVLLGTEEVVELQREAVQVANV